MWVRAACRRHPRAPVCVHVPGCWWRGSRGNAPRDPVSSLLSALLSFARSRLLGTADAPAVGAGEGGRGGGDLPEKGITKVRPGVLLLVRLVLGPKGGVLLSGGGYLCVAALHVPLGGSYFGDRVLLLGGGGGVMHCCCLSSLSLSPSTFLLTTLLVQAAGRRSHDGTAPQGKRSLRAQQTGHWHPPGRTRPQGAGSY